LIKESGSVTARFVSDGTYDFCDAVVLEALREGWNQRKVRMDDLWRYATVNRVANVMRPYMEALTA
jgi:hypothetical protein